MHRTTYAACAMDSNMHNFIFPYTRSIPFPKLLRLLNLILFFFFFFFFLQKVYKALSMVSDQPVAVKMLHESAMDVETLNEFKSEVEFLRTLRHRNIGGRK